MKKAKHFLQTLIMTSSAGKDSTPWHKNINPEGFRDVMIEIWMIYANCLENVRGISNIDVNKVPTTAKAQIVSETLQFSY